jgi:acyl carrier protein
MLNLIRKTIKEFVEVDDNAITADTHFIRDLHLTSYDIVSMIGRVEEDLGVVIPDNEIRNLDTVGELLEYLKKKMQ